jgi:hypothetical protein
LLLLLFAAGTTLGLLALRGDRTAASSTRTLSAQQPTAPAATTTTAATTATVGTSAKATTATTAATTVNPPSGSLDLPLPVPARDVWHTYVVDLVFGRNDGTTVRPGALRVWADGVNTPVIDVSDVNTLQRYGGVTQKWVQVWEGDYTRALPQVARQSFVLTRIGKTLADALADRPSAIGSTVPGQFYTGSGVDLGPPSVARIESRSATAARIPTSLGGNTSPPGPLETYEIKLTPNYVSPRDGAASNLQSVWVYPKSPTTPWRSPDSLHEQARYLLVDPRSTDSDGRRGQDEFWMVVERKWPSALDPSEHGSWGLLLNFHNVAGDVGWDSGSAVSAVSLAWEKDQPAPVFHLEYQPGS